MYNNQSITSNNGVDLYFHEPQDNLNLLLNNPFLFDCFDGLLFNDILPYQTPPQPPPQLPMTEQINSQQKQKQKAVNVSGTKGQNNNNNNRRVGKKDRHSKIYTAHGPRDRRMRLSLPVARKFFDLQDMLGFSFGPSHTVEWLFFHSKAAIDDLPNNQSFTTSSPSPNNNNNNYYTILNHNNNNNNNKNKNNNNNNNKNGGSSGGGGRGGVRRSKESRANAREWARKRTEEKLKMKKQGEQNPNIRVNDDEYHQVQMKAHLEAQMASIDGINTNYNGGNFVDPSQVWLFGFQNI